MGLLNSYKLVFLFMLLTSSSPQELLARFLKPDFAFPSFFLVLLGEKMGNPVLLNYLGLLHSVGRSQKVLKDFVASWIL